MPSSSTGFQKIVFSIFPSHFGTIISARWWSLVLHDLYNWLCLSLGTDVNTHGDSSSLLNWVPLLCVYVSTQTQAFQSLSSPTSLPESVPSTTTEVLGNAIAQNVCWILLWSQQLPHLGRVILQVVTTLIQPKGGAIMLKVLVLNSAQPPRHA